MLQARVRQSKGRSESEAAGRWLVALNGVRWTDLGVGGGAT